MKVAMVAAAVTFGAAASANAAVVVTNGNLSTGQGAGGTSDPYWTITAAVGTAPSGDPTIHTYNSAIFPFNAYAAPIGTSQWITPTANAGQSFDPSTNGFYTYTISFIATKLSIAGQFMSDNTVSDITLNPVGQHLSGGGGFTSPTAFAFNNLTLGGLYTLSFTVENYAQSSGNPTALDVFASAVPEPSTWAMMILGFLGLGFLGYRKSSKTSAASFRMV
ncbi:hypothetical protein QU42_06160 [Bradyrhizobium sp. UASWS1016]|nr:hypothetical protein QU41_11720 [Bradyrhizobium elkanii]OCX31988.1 hypothetical protein QU42_06160 [Bradyrhizobium sp. UASWS1016]